MPDYSTLTMITVVVAVGSAEAKRISDKKTIAFSPVLGGFLLGIFLFAIGLVNESLATKVNYLIIVGALMLNGAPLFQLLTPSTNK